MKTILIITTGCIMGGLVGFISKYTVLEWQYWALAIPISGWIGWVSVGFAMAKE